MSPLPGPIVNQKLVFMALFLNAALAAREAAFESEPTGGKLWAQPEALENLVSTIAQGLEVGWQGRNFE